MRLANSRSPVILRNGATKDLLPNADDSAVSKNRSFVRHGGLRMTEGAKASMSIWVQKPVAPLQRLAETNPTCDIYPNCTNTGTRRGRTYPFVPQRL